VTDP